MPVPASEIKALLKSKGWKMVDVAARWDKSVTWLSRIVNDADRPAQYDDAFAGLPKRKTVEVQRQDRHMRLGSAVIPDMTPPGRVWVSLSNTIADEDSRWIVVRSTRSRLRANGLKAGKFKPIYTLRLADTDEEIAVPEDDLILHFGDTGLDESID